MHIDKFKHDFKRLNGVYVTDTVILLRKPLELHNPATGNIIPVAAFQDSIKARCNKRGAVV